jgi:16S rRNA (guanine966-N2)-methyltransferase
MSRVIAGQAGGRRLVMPVGVDTRPTSDRTREGLFSTLTSLRGDLVDASFLDLYAGSGAVGLEAASRGANPVTLVERDATALQALRRNVADLHLPGVTVRETAVERMLAEEPDRGYDPELRFDIVFLDPPYVVSVDATMQRLIDGGWLVPDALVCVERASRDPALRWPDGLEPVKSRRYGDSTLWYGRAS